MLTFVFLGISALARFLYGKNIVLILLSVLNGVDYDCPWAIKHAVDHLFLAE